MNENNDTDATQTGPEATHTPGPWRHTPEKDVFTGRIWGPEGTDYEFDIVAEYVSPSNLPLVRAAPDMLEVLKWIESTGLCEHGGGGDMIRDAIAKAEGKS